MADKQIVKVGDRITAKLDDAFKDYRAGDTFYVQEIEEHAGVTVVVFTDNVGDTRRRRVSEFTVKHVPVAGATGEPAFKVGDRVRVLSDYLPWAHGGEIGTVQEVDKRDRDCLVKFETQRMGDHTWYVRWDNLELAPSFTIETGKFYRTRDGRKVGPMGAWYDDGSCFNSTDYINGGLWKPNGEAYFSKAKDSPTLIAEWVDEPASNDNSVPSKPAIVALIEDGQPKPSEQPRVHASEYAATKEAKLLAARHKGQDFGVFVLSETVSEPIPVYDHEWQNLAANGQKVAAIKELRRITGLGLAATKRAIEHWAEHDEQYSRRAA